MFLVVTNSHSKWPEVLPMFTTTTSKTIAVLQSLFSRYGISRQLVSDNGPQFTSEKFHEFTVSNGVKHIRSAPYHPATNGAAERMVQTTKKALRASHDKGLPLEQVLTAFLLRYRNSALHNWSDTQFTLHWQRTSHSSRFVVTRHKSTS